MINAGKTTIEPVIRGKIWEVANSHRRVAIIIKGGRFYHCDVLNSMGGTYLRATGISPEDALNTALDELGLEWKVAD